MSAFICNTQHILALAVWAARPVPGTSGRVSADWFRHFGGSCNGDSAWQDVALEYAEVLQAENLASVRARYPNHVAVDPPLFPTPRLEHCAGLEPVAILKMCDCLEYQSCETDAYHSSIAWRLLRAIREAAIRELPGYDAAPWEFRRD